MGWQETIQELRKTLSVRQIATHIGVSVQAIYQIADGTITPKNSTAGSLTRLLQREKVVQKTRERIDSRFQADGDGA
jgi:DNA-binding XRE family transcriptional regulator